MTPRAGTTSRYVNMTHTCTHIVCTHICAHMHTYEVKVDSALGYVQSESQVAPFLWCEFGLVNAVQGQRDLEHLVA